MQGGQDNEGVSFRALRTLLESGGSEKAVSRKTNLTLSVLEIHREAIHDLLAPPLPKGEKLDVRLLGGEGGGVHVPGLRQLEITSISEAISLLNAAAAARAQARTDMNESSSRSHCVVTVCATTTDEITGQRCAGERQQLCFYL
jgi:kinesin family protein C2/C3